MNIKVLGTGCKKCEKTYELVVEALKELSIDGHVEKVEDLKTIVTFGVMTTPTLVINEKIYFKGKVPNKKKLIDVIKEEM